MPLASLGFPLLLGGLALALGASSQPSGGNGPPPPTPPPGPGGFTPGQLDGLIEIRTVDGQPCQFFRPQVVSALYGELSQTFLVPLPPQIEQANPLPGSVPGAVAFFQAVHASQLSALPQGLAPASVAVLAAAKQGLAVLGTLTLPQPTTAGDRWVAIAQRSAVATLARQGTKWAIVLDPAIDYLPPPPATGDGGGQGGGQGVPGGGGGLESPPIPPPPPPPPLGGGGGQASPPVPGDGLDPGMPAAVASKVRELLADDGIAPEALEAAAADLEGDYPMAAAALRARAAELRERAHLEAVANGGSPFTIRSGDIPSNLAAYYTGDGTRWHEILSVNPGMHSQTINGVTQLVPWHGSIKLPLSWKVWSKPLPPVAHGGPAPQEASTPAQHAPAGNDVVWIKPQVIHALAPKVAGRPRDARGRFKRRA